MNKFIDFLRYITPEIIKVKIGTFPFVFIGYLLSILKVKKCYRQNIYLTIDHPGLTLLIRGMIFCGYYENSEPAILEKYLSKDLDVIEFGAGIGLSTLTILKKIQNKKIISVEPDKISYDIIKKNIQINNFSKRISFGNKKIAFNREKIWGGVILNMAVNYNSKFAKFNSYKMFLSNHVIDNNIKIPKLWQLRDTYNVQAITLKDIVKKFKIKYYQLVCDIEGKEIELIYRKEINPKYCLKIIIDLHDLTYKNKFMNYSDVAKKIIKLGYKEIFSSINQKVFISLYK
jgi:FkbM family methyltransferase